MNPLARNEDFHLDDATFNLFAYLAHYSTFEHSYWFRHLIHQVATPTETVSTPVATPLSQGKELSKEAVATPIHVTPALSKNAQYRKLRSEWKSNVRLAKSNIQVCSQPSCGLGNSCPTNSYLSSRA